MIEIRRILVPVDFSEFSERALRHAGVLARWFGADVHALHVLPTLPVAWAHSPAVDAGLRPLALDRLRSDLADFLLPAAEMGIRTRQHLRAGEATREIVDFARAEAMDLIVMGTHGGGGFRHFVLGSVADKVARGASCPVMTVCRAERREAADRPPFKRILCAVDFLPASQRALSYALSIAEEADAELTLLHVAEPYGQRELRQHARIRAADHRGVVESRLKERLGAAVPADARPWCRPREVVISGVPWEEIVRVAADDHAELIVMGAHGRGGFDRVIFGSTAEQVVSYASCPVLTVGRTETAAPQSEESGRDERMLSGTHAASDVGRR